MFRPNRPRFSRNDGGPWHVCLYVDERDELCAEWLSVNDTPLRFEVRGR